MPDFSADALIYLKNEWSYFMLFVTLVEMLFGVPMHDAEHREEPPTA